MKLWIRHKRLNEQVEVYPPYFKAGDQPLSLCIDSADHKSQFQLFLTRVQLRFLIRDLQMADE